IQTIEPYGDELAFKYIDKVYVKEQEKKSKTLEIFNHNIRLYKPDLQNMSYDEMDYYKQLELIKNFYLPIGMTTTTYMPYNEVEKLYTVEEAKQILLKNFKVYLEKLHENNIQILTNDVKFSKSKDKLILSGELVVAEKVGKIAYFDENIRRQDYAEYFTEENDAAK
ncbi:MAG: sporulation protein YqfD, partial [Vallitaleaceae bacterium]|nr:sporulation protein YqfD [Vallitaleaceae bacterium]